ncbi:MAG: C1 family peptidase [Planctomycetaceae bacterium]
MARQKRKAANKSRVRPASPARSAQGSHPLPWKLDARPDTPDFRDLLYVPTLVEVPRRVDLSRYRAYDVPILDQGQEGACTGFGLATVVHYLLLTLTDDRDATRISARMLYEMARRYDEWPGEDYSGSSARGAMKGWHKHGVCTDELWPYVINLADSTLTDERAEDAAERPLGAYYRVNHKDLVAMHSACAEVGILYATAAVHEGWQNVGADGIIHNKGGMIGGHAFAIVAYDNNGFWIQNSWGPDWGKCGYARIEYDDWLEHGNDVWVARLGAPVKLRSGRAAATVLSAVGSRLQSPSFSELRPHIISLGNDGQLRPTGPFGTTSEDVREIFQEDFPRITRQWKKKRLLLYAHGGLVGEQAAIQRLADYLPELLEAETYPVSFIWRTDYWSTITNILKDALSRRRDEGVLGSAVDFMLDRVDDMLEPLARVLTGKASWDEMKENGLAATTSAKGGAAITLKEISRLLSDDPDVELHLVGHSAGSIFHAPLVQLLCTNGTIKSGPMKGKKGLGITAKTCTLWAPACTMELFKETYAPLVEAGQISKFALFTLTDRFEQDDHCAKIYNKSLLYLVSNAFEKEPRIPLIRPEGVPLLGMEKFIEKDAAVTKLLSKPSAAWIRSPNTNPNGSIDASTAQHHGDFDDDEPTVRATLARILGKDVARPELQFQPGAATLRECRRALQSARLPSGW